MVTTKNTIPQPWLMRVLCWAPWTYRAPRLWAVVRFISGTWNLILGAILLSAHQQIGNWSWLGLLCLTGSALLFWTAYRLVLVAQSS
jgi:hypothetical protein